jgi:PAS domain S-box-containing protein
MTSYTAADHVLEALDALVDVVTQTSVVQIDLLTTRAEVIHQARRRGATYSEIVNSAIGPLALDVVNAMLAPLLEAGGRLRRAEANALYAEGLSMDRIARLFRVSRQRVSALLSTPADQEAVIRRGIYQSAGLVLTDPEFRLIAESIPQITFVASAEGSTEYFNREGADYIGLPRRTTYKGDWWTLLHPDDVEQARSTWQETTETATPYRLDARIRRVDGEFRWHSIRALAVRHPDERVTKWIGTAVDIDDQKRVEDELRRAEREVTEALSLLEALQACAPVGFGFVDRDFRVVRMNERLAAVNGAPLDDQLGRTVAELVPTLWPELEDVYLRVLLTGEPVRNLAVVGDSAEAPGSPRRWLANYYPVRVDDELVGIGLVLVDTTTEPTSA